jgi:FAS-associated factor 2
LPRATPFLNRLKRERLSLEEARHLREEQDRAFRHAEKRDRERMEAEKQAKELERIKAERAEREAEEKQRRIQDRKAWRRYARKHLLPQSTGSIRVAMRTPLNAERNVRSFEPGPSTVPLFIFAETLLIPKEDKVEDDPDQPPLGYEPEWDFRIVTTYPRKEVERVESGGEAVWDLVKSAGGALVAEKEEHGSWADAEIRELNGEDSDEEVIQ